MAYIARFSAVAPNPPGFPAIDPRSRNRASISQRRGQRQCHARILTLLTRRGRPSKAGEQEIDSLKNCHTPGQGAVGQVQVYLGAKPANCRQPVLSIKWLVYVLNCSYRTLLKHGYQAFFYPVNIISMVIYYFYRTKLCSLIYELYSRLLIAHNQKIKSL